MAHSKIVLLDIDRTLFDTDEFVIKTDELISKTLNISKDEITLVDDEYVKTIEDLYHYNFLDFMKLLPATKQQYEMLTNEYENNSDLYPKYTDVIPALDYIQSANYQIGIFSEGTPSFQRVKLKNLRIDKYINSDLVFIEQTKRTPEFLSKLPDRCFIVDDNIEIIELLLVANEFQPIYLNRNTQKTNTKRRVEINSLKELGKVLE